MIDTVKIISPEVTHTIAEEIRRACIRREGVRMIDGEVIYTITTGSLQGSWDNRISVRVHRDNRIQIEGSIHKAIAGHNVFGGPTEFKKSVSWFVSKVAVLLGVSLPPAEDWEVYRIDVAEVFWLNSNEGVIEYIHWLKLARYPRREKTKKHYYSTLYFPGERSTLKFYAKLQEFLMHDKKVLKGLVEDRWLDALERVAESILRVEVEVKSRMLKDHFGRRPQVRDIEDYMLDDWYSEIVGKLIEERNEESMLLVVNRREEVKCRLYDMYSAKLARALFTTWNDLAIEGEERVKHQMSSSTFYRHLEKLKEAGVSWFGSDIVVGESSLRYPIDFAPSLSDNRRIVGEFKIPNELTA